MDIQMPEVDGIEAIRRLPGGPEPVPVQVLILTTFDIDRYVLAALRAGASGFLLKDTPPNDLLAAIRVVADGEALLSPQGDPAARCEVHQAVPAEKGIRAGPGPFRCPA